LGCASIRHLGRLHALPRDHISDRPRLECFEAPVTDAFGEIRKELMSAIHAIRDRLDRLFRKPGVRDGTISASVRYQTESRAILPPCAPALASQLPEARCGQSRSGLFL
jgi:hypothetical protein